MLIPAIYRANFRDPSSFLFAQKFPMRDRDTIYVGNAEAIEVSKLFAYLQLWTSARLQELQQMPIPWFGTGREFRCMRRATGCRGL